jgi:hypothetical protein
MLSCSLSKHFTDFLIQVSSNDTLHSIGSRSSRNFNEQPKSFKFLNFILICKCDVDDNDWEGKIE